MTAFHAQRQIVEHPALLFDHLRDRGISLRETDATSAAGQIDDISFWIRFNPKRFRVNLTLIVGFPKISYPKAPASEDEARAFLAAIRRPRELRDQICSVLSEIGILPFDSPIGDELNFVTSQFASHIALSDIVHVVREQQKLVSSFVGAEDFQSAARHRDRREQLLDSLYDLCAGSLDA